MGIRAIISLKQVEEFVKSGQNMTTILFTIRNTYSFSESSSREVLYLHKKKSRGKRLFIDCRNKTPDNSRKKRPRMLSGQKNIFFVSRGKITVEQGNLAGRKDTILAFSYDRNNMPYRFRKRL